jgi:hypothetical protein
MFAVETVQNTIANLLENYFHNIFMKLAEKKWISLIAQTCLMLFKKIQSYLKNVMSPTFGVSTYWHRQEFAKSRGMVHWHGLCWRSDSEPHNLLYNAI